MTVQPNREQNLSEVELEDMIEHRALELLEDIEEDKRQKRVEQLTAHMQTQVNGWAEEFNGSKDTQHAMMDIMMDYVHGRVEVHVLLKDVALNVLDGYFWSMEKVGLNLLSVFLVVRFGV